jgi:hypothetical protein
MKRCGFLMILFFLCVLALQGMAQTVTGAVRGAITDPSGATVTATNTASGVAAATKTNDNGEYSIRSLQIGQYKLIVTSSGFATARCSAFALEIHQTAEIDIPLRTNNPTSDPLGIQNNFIGAGAGFSLNDQGDAKVDWQLRPWDKVTFRYLQGYAAGGTTADPLPVNFPIANNYSEHRHGRDKDAHHLARKYAGCSCRPVQRIQHCRLCRAGQWHDGWELWADHGHS